VRPDIRTLFDRPYAAPKARGPIHVLVTGGSQGARILSEAVPQAFAALPAPPSDLPTAEALKSEVGEAQADALYVTNSTAPATWELDADDDFVARARAAVGAADLQPPTDAEIAEAEAYAAAARARAKAPPVPK
jgi:hypothetical protein